MIWDEKETLNAADTVTNLSSLLEQENFYKNNALNWLNKTHINKFIDALDTKESTKLRRFAYTWHFTSDPDKTLGFPLLNSLWSIAFNDDNKRPKSSEISAGKKLVAHLLQFEPDWIGSWWKWYSKNKFMRNDSTIDKALIDALTLSDLERCASVISNEGIAEIIIRRSDLLDAIPKERWKEILSLVLRDENPEGGSPLLCKTLACSEIFTSTDAIIDGVIKFKDESELFNLFNYLVKIWHGPLGSDPVARMISKDCNEHLDKILHSPWHECKQPNNKKGDEFLWKCGIGWYEVEPAIATAISVAPSGFRLELGFSIGRHIAESGKELTKEEFYECLKTLNLNPVKNFIDVVFPMVELWYALRMLAKYEKDSWNHKTELIGLRTKVVAIATASPDLWAQSLPWIFIRSSAFGNIAQSVTLELATTTSEVHTALENACNDEIEHIRLMGRGLRALLHGLEEPESGLARTLADAAAHYMDGMPIFPHPLSPLSATWLNDYRVEYTITNGVKRASERFAAEVRDQGGDIEESLTKALVKEIEMEFRNIKPQLKALCTTGSQPSVPILSVCQRPSSKCIEEPVYGCDLSWIINGTIHGRYRATWVELIQIKKSSALQLNNKRKFRADSWKIDCKQLSLILKWSATATYWLIAFAGEVLVIPARHIEAIRNGTEKYINSKTFTIGYHEVRSASIPLEQYLGDLLIGQWVGTSSEEVVQFALGKNSNIRPRVIIEVTISMDHNYQ